MSATDECIDRCIDGWMDMRKMEYWSEKEERAERREGVIPKSGSLPKRIISPFYEHSVSSLKIFGLMCPTNPPGTSLRVRLDLFGLGGASPEIFGPFIGHKLDSSPLQP